MRNNTTEEQSRRQKEIRESQFLSFSLQSDKKKIERKHADLQAEVRQMQLEISHLKASLESKEITLRSADREIEMINELIVREKKHLSSL